MFRQGRSLFSQDSPGRTTALEQLINLAPLADIIFTLLLFFMLTSPFITQWGIKVQLPAVQNVTNIRPSEIEVTVRSDDRIFIKEKEVSLQELMTEFRNFAKVNQAVIITGDKDASLGRTLAVWDAAKTAGIRELNIRTKLPRKHE
ncbi:MAG: biopolymer transporter ExbD [Planctomycetes bacterium]|nr:biopolymer transporter ExbD [Planctomycetota bacterium]